MTIEFHDGYASVLSCRSVQEVLGELEISSQSRWTFPRIKSASAVHTKGFGFWLL